MSNLMRSFNLNSIDESNLLRLFSADSSDFKGSFGCLLKLKPSLIEFFQSLFKISRVLHTFQATFSKANPICSFPGFRFDSNCESFRGESTK